MVDLVASSLDPGPGMYNVDLPSPDADDVLACQLGTSIPLIQEAYLPSRLQKPSPEQRLAHTGSSDLLAPLEGGGGQVLATRYYSLWELRVS